MKLNELITTPHDIIIENLMIDSREKTPNSLFLCLPGLKVDSHNYIPQAIQNGATAIIGSKELDSTDISVPYIKVDDINAVYTQILKTFYNNPNDKLTVLGVTGTNGKSTTTKTIQNLLTLLNKKAGYIGTISIDYEGYKSSPKLTTPNPLVIQSTMRDMVNVQIETLCLEASSHGIALHRLDAVDFDSLAFTNLSHDHLDYHKTMEDYFETKASLFKRIKDETKIIINIDDEYGKTLYSRYPQATTFGQDKSSDFQITDIILNQDSSTFTLKYKENNYQIESPLVALFNVYNLVCALVILYKQCYDLEELVSLVPKLPQVEGRLKRIDVGQTFRVLVDYAHAPDSMEKVLKYLQKSSDGKVITIFGSAGDRDITKRPEMGRVADMYSDYIILTEDDYRDENPLDINEEIAQGITTTPFNSTNDRYQAIAQAIHMASDTDTIIIFGKGEELYMYAENNTKIPWIGDHIACEQLIKEKLNHE